LNITNSIIAGYATGASFESISAGGNFSDNVVHAYTAAFNGTAPGTGNATNVSANANAYLKLGSALANPFYTTTGAGSFNVANLIPISSSPAYGTASTFKGAFQPGVAAWTTGWTQFSPKTY